MGFQKNPACYERLLFVVNNWDRGPRIRNGMLTRVGNTLILEDIFGGDQGV
jgi:hypothetical protein